jgi:TolA-binding protein
MADRVEALREAALARHANTVARAAAALQVLTRRGEPITFRQLAETAGVSRSWLYRQPDLRDAIERLRGSGHSQGHPVAAPQQATPDSLRQQLHAYRGEIARLRAENQALGEQLARKLGAARAESVTKRAGHH